MRTRRITLFVLAITATLLWTTTTQALTLNMVTIGDPGNPDFDGQGGGSIAATYEIGATEVTVADWVEFLNAADPDADNDKGLWGGAMQNNALGGVSKNLGAAEGSRFEVQAGEGNHPINFVNLYDVMVLPTGCTTVRAAATRKTVPTHCQVARFPPTIPT